MNPTKRLTDFPRIAESYVKMPDHLLAQWRDEMAKRVERPVTAWDPLWAYLHLEAIDLEIQKRKQATV